MTSKMENSLPLYIEDIIKEMAYKAQEELANRKLDPKLPTPTAASLVRISMMIEDTMQGYLPETFH